MTNLKIANRLFSQGKYEEAKSFYEIAISEKLEISQSIKFNLSICEKRIGHVNKSPMPCVHEVIVCVHNAPDDVRKCIESIVKNRDGISRLIIIDDQSDEETVSILNEFLENYSWINVHRTVLRSGYTKAANFGISHSNGDIVTLLNSDTIVTSKWASCLREHFIEYPSLGILGPISNAASYQSVPGIVGSTTQTAINQLPVGCEVEDISKYCAANYSLFDMPFVPLVHGFCFSISRACLNSVGIFDETKFPRGYGEETDYCLRAQNAGFGLGIALNVYVYHSKSKSYADSDRVKYMQSGWDALVSTYGKLQLSRSISIMEKAPILQDVREKVYNKFYADISLIQPAMSSMKGELIGKKDKVTALAFYLPQFHPTPINDKNWGLGFTEWTNVTRARPRFSNHYQPKLPTELGFYDLRVADVMTQQAKLASEYGISGFCFYYYRFGKQRALDMPLESYKANKNAVLPYCYCWANESWTRAWDGKTSDILYEQTYDENTLNGLIFDLVDAIKDDRYIRIEGRPVFLIYQAAEIPNLEYFSNKLRNEVLKITELDLLLGTVYSHGFNPGVLEYVDFVVQFPPHRLPRDWPRKTIPRSEVNPYEPEREDYYESYDEVAIGALNSCGLLDKIFPGVCPDWDNTPRRQKNATTLIGSSPEKFSKWVSDAAKISRAKFANGYLPAPLIFVNAWNEWAEGAVLEPTDKYAREYLDALKVGLSSI